MPFRPFLQTYHNKETEKSILTWSIDSETAFVYGTVMEGTSELFFGALFKLNDKYEWNYKLFLGNQRGKEDIDELEEWTFLDTEFKLIHCLFFLLHIRNLTLKEYMSIKA